MELLSRVKYYEALREGTLLGLKCGDCGQVTVPPKSTCNNCHSRSMDVTTLSGRGTLKTFTVIRVAPLGLQAPYIVALAELEEGPWLIGNLEGIAVEETGMQILGKKIIVSSKEVAFDNYTDTTGVAPVFNLAE